MPETIIAYLAAKADAINADIDALESEPLQRTADDQTSMAWRDGYILRSNALNDALDATAEAILSRPAASDDDVGIQKAFAVRKMSIIGGGAIS